MQGSKWHEDTWAFEECEIDAWTDYSTILEEHMVWTKLDNLWSAYVTYQT